VKLSVTVSDALTIKHLHLHYPYKVQSGYAYNSQMQFLPFCEVKHVSRGLSVMAA